MEVGILTCISFDILGGKGRKTNRTISQLVPSAVSLRITETEQLYQAKANDWRNREHVVLDLLSN